MLDTQVTHQYAQLIAIFNQCFSEEYNTRLVKGNDEPIYLPADSQWSYHRIVFAHGFYASGLHEISHWCIAGEERRKLVDSAIGTARMGVTRKRRASLKR